MARRKKHMKLPNGYGSIKYLGNNRRRPYAVYPPVTQFSLSGSPVQAPAIGYAEDWYSAYEMLIAWKNGIAPQQAAPAVQAKGPTFAEVYERYFADKYLSGSKRVFSQSTINSTKTAYHNCSALYEREFCSLRYEDLQGLLDACPLRHASLEFIVTLFRQMYQYAMKYELTDKDYSQWVEIRKADDDEHGVPFSDSELKILWMHAEDDTAAMMLIMAYSGFRIGEWKTMTVNLDDWYFQGGIKTAAGKNRIVPIHSGIRSLVVRLHGTNPTLLPCNIDTFRKRLYALQDLGISSHTPHDARHTFSALCERYGVAENDRKRMLGHAFNDVTNKVYGHRTLEDLRTEIEKIRVCC